MATNAGDGAPTGIIPTMTDDDAEKAADFAQYFCTYAFLYHQKQMLTDTNRMRAYHSAIMRNAAAVRGKVVLDVGTGTGILAIWAAKAGARKVYAVEFTDMAKYAERLVKANKVENIVEVIKTSVEELELPEKVDIIVSEWMGYFLLRESMLDSVLVARDKHLKPGGIMMPSHATMYLSPLTFEEDRTAKYQEYMQSMREWYNFQGEMQRDYGVSMDCLLPDFDKEQRHYYMLTALWSELHPDHLRGVPQVVKHLDLRSCSLEDVKGLDDVRFQFANLNSEAPELPSRISGFAGWFTTDFYVGEGEISDEENVVTLDTSPDSGYTHWGQQVFYFPQPLDVMQEQTIAGSIRMMRQAENKRLYNVGIKYTVTSGNDEPSLDNTEEVVWELP